MFYEVFDFSWWCIQVVFSYMIWSFLHSRFAPVSTSRALDKESYQISTRLLTFLHALFCSCALAAYVIGLINASGLYMARAFSTAYLVVELQNTWANAEISTSNPRMQTLHHVITVCVLYGWMGMFIADRPTYGILVYFIGEPPIVFLQMTWLYLHMEQEHKRECAISGLLTIQSYLVCRVLCYGYVILFMFLPTCSVFNPFTWISLFMALAVYALNVLWFLDLIRKNAQFMPEQMLKTPLWATLIQYSAQLPSN